MSPAVSSGEEEEPSDGSPVESAADVTPLVRLVGSEVSPDEEVPVAGVVDPSPRQPRLNRAPAVNAPTFKRSQ